MWLLSMSLGCSPQPDPALQTSSSDVEATPPTAPTPPTEVPPTTTPPTTEPWCDGTTEAHDAFRDLWTVFDARYAVFEAHLGTESWVDLGQVHCDALGPETTDEALYDTMMALLRELDDGHVNLCAVDLGRCEDAWVSVYPHYPEVYRAELEVEANYLDAPLTWAAEDWVSWGAIGDVGYISLTSMEDLSPSGSEGADLAAARDAMDQALADLGSARGLVVDVRANEGGWDFVSLMIATSFAGDRALAWTEQVRDGPGHGDLSDPAEIYVADARPGAYNGPVVLLTGGGTFSAAETFVLAMRVRDDVTVLGERTSGHFSDLMGDTLANGWVLTLSGELYTAADGSVYEAVGAPVDLEVPLDAVGMQGGVDAQLEAALELLR